MMPEPIDPTGEVFVEADDASPTEEEIAPRRGALRTAGAISARVVVGCVAVGAIGALVAAAILIPLPGLTAHATSTVVTPVPTVQQLVCPGGLLRLGTASGSSASTASALGSPRIVSAAVPGSVRSSPFTISDAGSAGGPAAPVLLSTPPVAAGATRALVAGAQSESVKTDEFFGLTSAECTAATGSAWLVGGATSTGRTTLLLLENPTSVAATVAIQIYGETGAVTAPGMDGIAVAAGSQRVISLAGFAPNLVSPVVHVQSSGGQVVAGLEQTTVRGITPGGADFVGSTAAPQTTTVLPGVVVSGTAALQGLQGEDGFDDLATTLRLYLPSSAHATASITVLAENGTVTGKPITADLEPGNVTDLPLDQLSDGNYTVIVTAKVPVLASVRVSATSAPASSTESATDGSNAHTDFAWITPAPLLSSSVLLPIASGITAAVHLENPSARAEKVTLHALSGTDITATVPAHRAVSIPVVAGHVYRLTGFTELYASVSGVGSGTVTSYGISPIERGEGPIRVYG
jgi:Family of unknown function (DUF5719)